MIRVTSFGRLKSADWRDLYIERTSRLIPFRWKEIPLKKSLDKRTDELLPEERDFLKSENAPFILLDAGGKTFDSHQFYSFLFQVPERHFVIGPAAGFHKDFYARAEQKISLSALTFTHELAQTVFAECLYRAACQLKNHPFVK